MSCLEHAYLNWLLEDIAKREDLSIVFVALDGNKEIEKEK